MARAMPSSSKEKLESSDTDDEGEFKLCERTGIGGDGLTSVVATPTAMPDGKADADTDTVDAVDDDDDDDDDCSS